MRPALPAPALKTMQEQHTPAADLEPFTKALASAQRDAAAH
jgi:hypothetical protein